MGGPALLPGAIVPPKQRRLLPWTQAALPVPRPARALPRRRGQDPFADIVAGVQDLIQNIGKGASQSGLNPRRARLLLWRSKSSSVFRTEV